VTVVDGSTAIGIFRDPACAEQAVRMLELIGFPAGHIGLFSPGARRGLSHSGAAERAAGRAAAWVGAGLAAAMGLLALGLVLVGGRPALAASGAGVGMLLGAVVAARCVLAHTGRRPPACFAERTVVTVKTGSRFDLAVAALRRCEAAEAVARKPAG
jgi:hypothetical protein